MDFINVSQMIQLNQALRMVNETRQQETQRENEPVINLVAQQPKSNIYNNIYEKNYKNENYSIINTEGLGNY